MAYLLINDRQFRARADFGFKRKANEKYSAKHGDNEIDGLTNLYLRLLQKDTMALVDFWDCALSHYDNEQPSIKTIEHNLMNRIDEEKSTFPLFQEAFKEIDESYFFGEEVKNIRNGLLKDKTAPKNETPEQKEEREAALKRMRELYNELTKATSTK